ncbi:MAG: di/tricarboxylate transporter [Planctomycetota bacterium]|jgi:di/tricarboxylate transporter
MSPEALFTLFIVLSALVAMMTNFLQPDVALLAGVIILAAAGVIGVEEAFSGFSNPGMLTVAALFIVSAGLRETGVIDLVTTKLLGRPKTTRGAIARLALPVLAASAFLNNTTVVASMIPAVRDWTRRIKLPASSILMPLSFASILGGVCTLIGTSTNLVVSGLVQDAVATHPQLHEIGMFEISMLGLPIALIGCVLMVLLAPILLPDRTPPVSLTDDPRRYTMELKVPPGSRLIGQSLEQAGLRHLPGCFLAEIHRRGHFMPAVAGTEHIEDGDRLIFVGDVSSMVDLQRTPGLAAAPGQVFQLEGGRHERILIEAVVSPRNPLVGISIREGGFRGRYRAVIIGIARFGERVTGRIGDVVLRPGDTLLLEAQPGFVTEHRSRTDFHLVGRVEGGKPPRLERAWFAVAALAFVVVTVSLGLLPSVVAAFLGAGAMIMGRCCTRPEARASLDFQVLVAIAAAFGLGHAMQVTGLDVVLADTVMTLGAQGPMSAMIALYLLTLVLTELVTNNAAAVLCFPLALSLAERLEVSPMGYVIAVMVAASMSFLSPIGYQTNLMVMGPGGYRPMDFPRLGLPLSIAAAVTSFLLIPRIWPF